MKRILVTGATGKVGQAFIRRLLDDPRYEDFTVRALCHNRRLERGPRVEVVQGSIHDRAAVDAAIAGVTHVLHLATCKETPEAIMDVAVKGMFWLLEECRASRTFRQFLLVGGDAAVGHFYYPRSVPVVESQPHSAYPGCYALSKVLEEVMLQQYQIQYGLNGCCLRAPWIMEKDDFKYTLSFGDDVFGGPVWKDLVSPETAQRCRDRGTIPLLRDADGRPLRRTFVHVDDLVDAILAALDNPRTERQLYNICMDRPVDYGELAAYLGQTRGLDSIDIPSDYHSVWMDNAKAKFMLGWRPKYDLKSLIDSAWDYVRSANEPRRVWYPG
jgi:nucleoside-diphosphate-sugar epimerase